MKTVLLLTTLVLCAATTLARPPSPEELGRVRDGEGWKWNFTLTPKPLQKNPELNMTFFTEMTAAGRAQQPADPTHPVFYVMQSSGRHDAGESGGGKAPPPEDLVRVLELALARASLHPARKASNQPRLAIFFFWGVHAQVSAEMAQISPDLALDNLFERASLVGGTTFRTKLMQAYQLDEDFAATSSLPVTNIYTSIRQLELESRTMEYLLQQVREDLYYVVASAYDFESLSRNQHVLLWRTKMTVGSSGVSLRESLAPMIVAATPYLGRETAEAVALTKRIDRRGTVRIDPAEVLEYIDPAQDETQQVDPTPRSPDPVPQRAPETTGPSNPP